MEKMYHRGVMRSKVSDCQFVCIRQSDYYAILRQGEENTRRHEEDGVLVLVTEKSHIDACHREANLVIKVSEGRVRVRRATSTGRAISNALRSFLRRERRRG